MSRLDDIHRDALRILDEARAEHFADHEMVAAVVLFSGGNDSTILAHVMRPHATHFGHANTTIGVEQTRQFVRDVADEWGIPLLERSPDPGDTFEDMVRDFGFPGPAQHFLAFQRLKERGIRKIRRELVGDPRTERILFISGVRRDESSRRSRTVRESWRDGSSVWVAPLANWTDDDMKRYREENPDVPRNEVTDHLHLSGECLCGAFAGEGEEDLIRFFYPEVGEEIDRVAALARETWEAGTGETVVEWGPDGAEIVPVRPFPIERCRWGWGAYRDRKLSVEEWDQLSLDLDGTLCQACDLRVGVEDVVVEVRS